MTPVVLDASAGVEWLLLTDIGRRVDLAVTDRSVWVPEHYFVETAATIRRLELLDQISSERAHGLVTADSKTRPNGAGRDHASESRKHRLTCTDAYSRSLEVTGRYSDFTAHNPSVEGSIPSGPTQ